MDISCEVKTGRYFDSVVLMNISERLREEEGVVDALVVMATDNNKKILDELGMLCEKGNAASVNDLIIAIKCEDYQQGRYILEHLEDYFVQKASDESFVAHPTFKAARTAKPNANLAVISIPGEYAEHVARDVLAEGLHVLIFSDHVSLDEEISLKKIGSEAGMLVMGPDCGVSNLNGGAFVLASITSSGPIGAVGATGSGLQELSALITRAGSGVTQVIGTGGRDLEESIGAITTHQGLALLDNDPLTKVIVLVGKFPSPGITNNLCNSIRKCRKPVVACFLGSDPKPWLEAGAYFAPTMDAASRCAVALSKKPDIQSYSNPNQFDELRNLASKIKSKLDPNRKYLRGVFGAGTFVGQAQQILSGVLSPLYSNAPFARGIRLPDLSKSIKHTLLDIGDEVYTKGRAHPVIDPLPYRMQILKEVRDPEVAVLLMDTTLGPATHPNPAGYITSAIKEAHSSHQDEIVVVASVTGTALDPQNYALQRKTLEDAGVYVMESSAQAAILAGLIVAEHGKSEELEKSAWLNPQIPAALYDGAGLDFEPLPDSLMNKDLEVINIGVKSMGEALHSQGIDVTYVDWKPPAGGDLDIIRLLERLG
jgi:FdrA protein